MKPRPFKYVRADTLGHASDLLKEFGDDAKVIAGGQSLVPMMNLRLASPTVLVDISRVAGYSSIFTTDAEVTAGALVRHQQLLDYPGPLPGLLPTATRFIGHYPIRAQGTMGGTLAHGDSAAELAVAAVFYDAVIRATSSRGVKEYPASEFFLSPFTTVLREDEIIIGVDWPLTPGRSSFNEFSLRRGDYALALFAMGFEVDDGICRDVRVAIGGVTPVPVRLAGAERALEGTVPAMEGVDMLTASVVDEVEEFRGESLSRGMGRVLRGIVWRGYRGVLGKSSSGPPSRGGSSGPP